MTDNGPIPSPILVSLTVEAQQQSKAWVHNRRKYDQGGVGALAATDMEVDMSQVGMAGTAFAAMASRLGLRTLPLSLKASKGVNVRHAKLCGFDM